MYISDVNLIMFSREFEDAAVGVLNECYRRDKVMSRQLLVRDLEIWGSTALMIADAAREMDFMGHSCCQTKLNEIWKGKMALYTSTLKVIRGASVESLRMTVIL